MSKISTFHKLLDEGKTREEARDEAGIADGTARVQYAKWKKTAVKEPEPQEEDTDEEDVTIEDEQ